MPSLNPPFAPGQWFIERNHAGVSLLGRVGALGGGEVKDGRFDHLGRFELAG